MPVEVYEFRAGDPAPAWLFSRMENANAAFLERATVVRHQGETYVRPTFPSLHDRPLLTFDQVEKGRPGRVEPAPNVFFSSNGLTVCPQQLMLN